MKRHNTHLQKMAPWRRYTSLLLTLVWFSVLIQPCVLAADSISDTDTGVLVGSHERADVVDADTIISSTATYAHCQDMQASESDWLPSFNKPCCDGDDSIVVDSAGTFKSKIKNVQLIPILTTQLAEIHVQPKANATANLSNGPLPNPSIIDLFRVYLI